MDLDASDCIVFEVRAVAVLLFVATSVEVGDDPSLQWLC